MEKLIVKASIRVKESIFATKNSPLHKILAHTLLFYSKIAHDCVIQSPYPCLSIGFELNRMTNLTPMKMLKGFRLKT